MKTLIAIPILAASLIFAACGDVPEEAPSPTSSAAVDPGGYYYTPNFGPPLLARGGQGYWCQNAQWLLAANVTQKVSTFNGMWRANLDLISAAQDTTWPTMELSCPVTWFASGGSSLRSTAATTCTAYTHAANDPADWRWAGSVTIPAGGLAYFPADGWGPNGHWSVDVWPSPSAVGLPGFCGPHFTVQIGG